MDVIYKIKYAVFVEMKNVADIFYTFLFILFYYSMKLIYNENIYT